MPTTPGAIRDSMIALVERSIAPDIHRDRKFVAYREQLPGFRTWAEANPASCLRRFSIRSLGDRTGPTVVSSDTEEVSETFEVVVSYPVDSRHGAKPLTSIDDVITSDIRQIHHVLHVVNSPSGATVIRLDDEREHSEGDAVAFAVIRYRVDYYWTQT